MIFLSLVYIHVVQKSKLAQNHIYKLSSDDKILSSLIKKTCLTYVFLNHNNYAPCFKRIDFPFIPSYIEVS